MIFKEQIEKRREQEKRALWEAYENLAFIVDSASEGMHGSLGDSNAYRQVLESLGIDDINLDPENGDLQTQFEQILKVHTIMYRKIVLEKCWWKDTVGTILAHLKSGQLIALKPGKWSGYYYLSPDTGKKVWLNKHVNEEIDSDAYCFYPSLPSGELKIKDIMRFILSCLGKQDWLYVSVSCFVVTLLGALTPYMNKLVFDNIIPSGNTEDIVPVAGLLIGASLGSLLFSITRGLILTRLRDKVNIYSQAAVMARTYHLPAPFFKKFSSGDLSNRIMGFTDICVLLSDRILTATLVLLFSLIYFFQVFYYAESLLVPCICILLVTFVLAVSNYWVYANFEKKLLELSSRLQGLVYSLYSGVQKIKLAGAEIRIFRRWTTFYKESAYLGSHPPVYIRLNSALSGLCSLGGTLVLYYYAIMNKVDVSSFIAFSAAFGMINGSFMSFFGLIPELARVKPLYKLLEPILTEVPERNEESIQVDHLSGNIEIMNLSFRYIPDGPLILNNFNLSVKAGEYLGIVGTSGSGKSTLFRLLLGFETPEQGAIVYDQYELHKIDKPSLRRCIGTCLQGGKLFIGDIFKNITITAPWSTHEEAWEAARMAGCADDIDAMPMKMFSLISEGGGGISGGQKQRILIARALINKPAILLFDEATSALDNIKQLEVTKNLDHLGCTRLVIAHRLSTIQHCDRIIVLDKGHIAEEGTFEQLMEKRGLFYEMSKRQL